MNLASSSRDAKKMFAAIETRFGVWMNKAEVETMSIDDLYNLKIVKQSVKKYVGASSGAQNLAFMTALILFAKYEGKEVECFNCHKMGHFAKECRAPRNKEGQLKNQDTTRKQGNNEDTSSKAMLAIDGVGFNWSDMAEEQCDDLIVKLNQTEFTAATYKRGLATVEEQLITYKKNEAHCNTSKGKDGYSGIIITGVELQLLLLNRYSPYASMETGPRAVLMKTGLKTFNTARTVNTAHPNLSFLGKPQQDDIRFVDSGCSRHMTGNIAYLSYFKEFDEAKIFEDVYSINELKFNLFSVPQMCDKKNYVIFTDTECLVLSPNFKLPDESQILLKIPRKDNMYSFDMKNIVPKESLTCLVAKDALDESMLWHKRLGHISFKNINKLVKDNLVRGLHTKRFENDQTCVACLKGGWQHSVHCQSNVWNPITKPLFYAYMDLFVGPPDEISEILKNFIKKIENLVDKKVKIIRSDNGTEFKNKVMDDFCREKGTSTEKEEINQDCIVMPIWKDASYFDSPSKDVGNGEPKFVADVQKQVKDGPDNENDEKDKSEDDSSPKEVNIAGQHVNTASPEVKFGRFKLNTVDPSVNTASSYDQDSPKDMFIMGASHTLEATHVEFFNDEDEPEVDLRNITNSYTVPTTPNTRIHKDHPFKNVIGDVKSSVQTRRITKPTSEQGFLSVVYEQKTHDTLNTCLYVCFLSQIEPTSIAKALSDSSWVEEMQEELLNKKDEIGIVIRNKERLVAQGHRQEEGIDYEEVFAHVARIEAIRLFLAYASFMGFLVYQMNVKSAFLYGTIEEEVYVTQPPEFKDHDNPNKVYKVVKELYGLHQAPRAWYETLANYLLGNRFKRGKIDQTLFIKKQKRDILLVQVYVDDIIFGSINKELCTRFEKLMKDKFQMSSMGELTFFLGLQVQQKEDGIFISQDKYVDEILKKFNYTDVKSASTPVDLEKPLVKDGDANDVDVHLYRSMIGSLMYLTASRPDIIYLKGKPTLGLWYSRDSPFELVAYTDSDYAGATQDRKSTTRGCQFLGNRLISWQCKKQTVVATSTTEAEYVAAASCYGQVGDEAVHKELGDIIERAVTTASSLEAEQDSGNINKTQSMATLNGSSP
ncbi:putative ribonuclease H-like domain-containing protein [Tanacetum coccineum]